MTSQNIFPAKTSYKELALLIRDVRTAKRILADAKRVYSKIEGELCKTDVLYAIFLQSFKQGVLWHFIKSRWKTLEQDRFSALFSDKKREHFYESPEWKNLTSGLGSDLMESSCRHVVGHFLEDRKHIQSAISGEKYRELLIQLVDQGLTPPIDLTDKKYLTTISEWKSKVDSKSFIAGLATDAKWSDSFEYFQEILPNTDPEFSQFRINTIGEIKELVHALNHFALNKLGADADSKTVAGFIPVWRTFTKNNWRNTTEWQEHGLDWCIEEGRFAMPISFPFALDFDYYWIYSDSTGFSDQHIKDVRNIRWSTFLNCFKDDPRKLLDAFPESIISQRRWTLSVFIEHGYSTSKRPPQPLSDEQWIVLNPILTAILQADSTRASLMLSPFFATQEHRIESGGFDPATGKYIYTEDKAIWIFKAPTSEGKRHLLKELLKYMPEHLKSTDEMCRVIAMGQI